jgi:hypothetical protein
MSLSDNDREKYIMKETVASGFNADIEATRSNMIGEVSPNGKDGTKRGLKSRHAQMIALGGTIGTGRVHPFSLACCRIRGANNSQVSSSVLAKLFEWVVLLSCS